MAVLKGVNNIPTCEIEMKQAHMFYVTVRTWLI
jgi:hypothetical protein